MAGHLWFAATCLQYLTRRRKKQVKVLLQHKAADTCTTSREQTNSGTKYFTEVFPYEYISFHTRSEFGHEFLRSHTVNSKKFTSSKQDCNFNYFLICSIWSSKCLWNHQDQNFNAIVQYSCHAEGEPVQLLRCSVNFKKERESHIFPVKQKTTVSIWVQLPPQPLPSGLANGNLQPLESTRQRYLPALQGL